MNVRQLSGCDAAREDVQKDIDRMQALWTEARSRFGAGGPYLYGTFSNADAYFAPVVFRFNTYGVKCSPVVASYVKGCSHIRRCSNGSLTQAEPQVVDHEEPEFIYEKQA